MLWRDLFVQSKHFIRTTLLPRVHAQGGKVIGRIVVVVVVVVKVPLNCVGVRWGI